MIESIDELADRLENHGEKLVQVENHVKWARRGVIVVALFGLLGIAVGARGVTVGRQAKDAAETARVLQAQIETDHTAQLVSTCVQDNVKTDRTRAAFKRTLLSLVPGAKAVDDLNETQRAAYDAYTKATDDALPYRDCSPNGIAQYLQEPPPDPAAGK